MDTHSIQDSGKSKAAESSSAIPSTNYVTNSGGNLSASRSTIQSITEPVTTMSSYEEEQSRLFNSYFPYGVGNSMAAVSSSANPSTNSSANSSVSMSSSVSSSRGLTPLTIMPPPVPRVYDTEGMSRLHDSYFPDSVGSTYRQALQGVTSVTTEAGSLSVYQSTSSAVSPSSMITPSPYTTMSHGNPSSALEGSLLTDHQRSSFNSPVGTSRNAVMNTGANEMFTTQGLMSTDLYGIPAGNSSISSGVSSIGGNQDRHQRPDGEGQQRFKQARLSSGAGSSYLDQSSLGQIAGSQTDNTNPSMGTASPYGSIYPSALQTGSLMPPATGQLSSVYGSTLCGNEGTSSGEHQAQRLLEQQQSDILCYQDGKVLSLYKHLWNTSSVEGPSIIGQTVDHPILLEGNLSTSPGSATLEDECSKRLLFLLEHARGCGVPCEQSNCLTTRMLLAHQDGCSASSCLHPGCSDVKELLKHNEDCKNPNCPVRASIN